MRAMLTLSLVLAWIATAAAQAPSPKTLEAQNFKLGDITFQVERRSMSCPMDQAKR